MYDTWIWTVTAWEWHRYGSVLRFCYRVSEPGDTHGWGSIVWAWQ